MSILNWKTPLLLLRWDTGKVRGRFVVWLDLRGKGWVNNYIVLYSSTLNIKWILYMQQMP